VRDHYQDIRRLGGDVLVVSFAPPPLLTVYEREQTLPFPVVADHSRSAYQAFGLERASWRAMLRAGVVWRFLRLMFRGWLPRRPNKGEDVLQLGGDFVLDAQRRLVYAHRSTEPTDRPPVAELLHALELLLR
jgi:hypothetical protein